MNSFFNDFLVVSYATKDGVYDKYLERLKISCDQVGLEFYGELFNSMSREEATLQKPEFIKNKLIEFNRPIVWLDCDSVVLEKFWLPKGDWDIGTVRNTKFSERKIHPKSSFFLVFLPTSKAFYFLDVWIYLCEADWIKGGYDHKRLIWTRFIIPNSYQEKDLSKHVKGKILRDAGRKKESNVHSSIAYYVFGIYGLLRKYVILFAKQLMSR